MFGVATAKVGVEVSCHAPSPRFDDRRGSTGALEVRGGFRRRSFHVEERRLRGPHHVEGLEGYDLTVSIPLARRRILWGQVIVENNIMLESVGCTGPCNVWLRSGEPRLPGWNKCSDTRVESGNGLATCSRAHMWTSTCNSRLSRNATFGDGWRIEAYAYTHCRESRGWASAWPR